MNYEYIERLVKHTVIPGGKKRKKKSRGMETSAARKKRTFTVGWREDTMYIP
jgi:hypothetical protein